MNIIIRALLEAIDALLLCAWGIAVVTIVYCACTLFGLALKFVADHFGPFAVGAFLVMSIGAIIAVVEEL